MFARFNGRFFERNKERTHFARTRVYRHRRKISIRTAIFLDFFIKKVQLSLPLITKILLID